MNTISLPIPVAQSETTAIINMIERAARDPGVDIPKLKELMELRKQVIADVRRIAFDRAIGAAKAKMPPIKKNRSVSFGAGKTSYQYEDLAEIERTVTPTLAEFGLKYRFRSDGISKPGIVIVTCILSHDDGHSEENSLPGPTDTSGSKNAIQAIGSVVTYLQRYTLKCALGLAASNDDDGHAAGNGGVVTEEQAEIISKLAIEVGADIGRFLKYIKAESISDIPARNYDNAVLALEAKRKANG